MRPVEGNAGALSSSQRLDEFPPALRLPLLQDPLRPRRIVEREDRCLLEEPRRAQARGMIRVSFDLGRSSLVALDQKTRGVTPQSHRRRIVLGHARSDLRRVGNNPSAWGTLAAGRTGHHNARTEEFQEIAST
jgi:hypothetical protein